MGHKMRVADGKQSDVHYESRVFHKERESNQQTTHEVGPTGSIRTRSVGRVSSRVHSGAASPKSERRKSEPHKSEPHTSKHRKSEPHESEHHKSKSPRRSSVKSHSSRRSADGCPAPKRAKSASRKSSKSASHGPMTGRERCYDQPRRRRPQPCTRGPTWQTGKYKRDLCGSGVVPARFGFMASRGKLWCKTPLSMYQATIGELGRRLLCREVFIPRDVRPGPPSNIEEYILPPCRGYYRKYDCLRPCEEEFVTYKQGKKVYRDRVERYWEPCLAKEQKHQLDINTYAHHNAALGLKVRRYNLEVPCW